MFGKANAWSAMGKHQFCVEDCVFLGLPPFLPFRRAALAFLALLMEPSAAAAGFLFMGSDSYSLSAFSSRRAS